MIGKFFLVFGWFLFAIWSYLFLVYILGFTWFISKNSKKFKYDRKLISFQFLFFIISTGIQIWFLIFFVKFNKTVNNVENLKDLENWILWIILLVLDLVFVLIVLLIVLLMSNNFAVKFEKEYTSFLGITILNTAIISVIKTTKGEIIIEYVYKKEKNMKWTEKIRLIKGMKITNFFFDNYKDFFNPERNLAFFDIDKVIINTKVNKETKNK